MPQGMMHAGALRPEEVYRPTFAELLRFETFRPQLMERYEQDHRLPNAALARAMQARHATLAVGYQTVYDSISPAAMPNDGSPVCGYGDGAYRATQAQMNRFKGPVVWITVLANAAIGCIFDDCEEGNAGPSSMPGWITGERHAGAIPNVYCGQSQWWAQIISTCEAAGVPQPQYIVANYTYNPASLPPAGSIGIQWTDQGGGGGYDISNVIYPWLGVQTAAPTLGFVGGSN